MLNGLLDERVGFHDRGFDLLQEIEDARQVDGSAKRKIVLDRGVVVLYRMRVS